MTNKNHCFTYTVHLSISYPLKVKLPHEVNLFVFLQQFNSALSAKLNEEEICSLRSCGTQ